MQKTVIIGNGIAGITAARHIRKNSDHEILVISAETPHFYSRTALMYVYMGHMRFQDTKPYEDSFWAKNKIDLLLDYVEKLDTEQKVLQLKSGKLVSYDQLLIATGSKPNIMNWPGKDLKGVQGLYSYQDLRLMEDRTNGIRSAVVVGGGLIGIELVEMLLSRGIRVTYLVRELKFWGKVLPDEESEMIEHHIRQHHVDLKLGVELKEILDNGSGTVRGVITSSGEELACQFVGLGIGVHPNTAFLNNSGIQQDKGILVDEFLQTNLPDVYAAGDCVQLISPPVGRRAIEQTWYTSRIMGETVSANILGNKVKYNPGPWFNSAKFFDIEYQVYGEVAGKLKDGEKSFFWKHPKKNKSFRINWMEESGKVTGINLLGYRMRHELLDQWLRAEKEVDFVMTHLQEAGFDQELSGNFEKDIVAAYNAETGKNIQLARKQWWQKLLDRK